MTKNSHANENGEKVISWLNDADNAPIPLNAYDPPNDSSNNEWKIARDFSLLYHIDDLLDLREQNIANKLYQNQSEAIVLEYIEKYLELPHANLYDMWQEMFRVDPVILPLYAAIMYRGINTDDRELRFKLVSMVDADKTFILVRGLASGKITHGMKFRSMGFIPQSPSMAITDMLTSQGIDGDDLHKLATPGTILIMLYKTISQIEIDTWVLRDPHATRHLLGEYVQYRGLSDGILKRSKNITYLDCKDCSKQYHHSNVPFEIVGGESYEDAYVIETLGLDKWRFVCPFAANSQYKIKRHLIEPFIAYLKGSSQSRVSAYHKHQEHIIANKMFFSRTIQPSVEYLESLAQDADMSTVKHNLTIALEKILDSEFGTFDADPDSKKAPPSFYHILSKIQAAGIKDKIMSVLIAEFRDLTKYHEFELILAKSSFPTSEILLSYIVEMQNFATIMYKALVDHVKDSQSDFDHSTHPIRQLLSSAVKAAVDEKIKQEGSIMNIINFKSRLLYIDSV